MFYFMFFLKDNFIIIWGFITGKCYITIDTFEVFFTSINILVHFTIITTLKKEFEIKDVIRAVRTKDSDVSPAGDWVIEISILQEVEVSFNSTSRIWLGKIKRVSYRNPIISVRPNSILIVLRLPSSTWYYPMTKI